MFIHIVWSFCEARDFSPQFFYLPFFADVNAITIYLSRTIYHVPSTPRGLTERTYSTFGGIHVSLLNAISLSVYRVWVGRIKARTTRPGKDFDVTTARDWIDFGFSYPTYRPWRWPSSTAFRLAFHHIPDRASSLPHPSQSSIFRLDSAIPFPN